MVSVCERDRDNGWEGWGLLEAKMSPTCLTVGKDGGFKSHENISNDGLQGCLEDFFLCGKCGKDMIKFVRRFDLSTSTPLDDSDCLIIGRCRNDGQGPMFLFLVIQGTKTNDDLNGR